MRFHTLRGWRYGQNTPDVWAIHCPKCSSKAEYFVDLTHSLRKSKRSQLEDAAKETSYPWALTDCKGQAKYVCLQYFPEIASNDHEGVVRCPSCADAWPTTVTRQDQFWYYAQVGRASIYAPSRKHLLMLQEYLASDSRAAFQKRYPGWEYVHFRYLPKSLLKIRHSNKLASAIHDLLET